MGPLDRYPAHHENKPLVSPTLSKLRRVAFNKSSREPQLVHQCVEEIAKASPISCAICDPTFSTSITYSILNQRSTQLAHAIISMTYGQLELPVAILLHNRSDIITASLGIMKAGCAFVPLSPDQPDERISHILGDLLIPHGSVIVITDNENSLRIHNGRTNIQVIIINGGILSTRNLIPQQRMVSLPSVTPQNLAYVIYTSGSTGVPKGVMVEHESILHRLKWLTTEYNFTSKDKGILYLNPAFDASLMETWSILCTGGCLIQATENVRLDSKAFMQFVEDNEITRAFLPAAFAERVWKLGNVHKLKTMFVGGEQLQSFPFSTLPYQVVNCYGPTEATVQVCGLNLKGDKRTWDNKYPPIGYPISGVTLEISSDGELVIGGVGLARGYWNNAPLTEEKFVTHKTNNSRWYRSGDYVVRCDISGAYIWKGRLDDQFKLNGFLIEPREVEIIILSQLAGIVKQVKVCGVGNRLVAFLVLTEGATDKWNSQLRDKVEGQLPSYMIPSFFIVPSFPTTPTGKIDKAALCQEFMTTLLNSRGETSSTMNAKTTEITTYWEKSVARVWSKVLTIPQTALNTTYNLFQVGGNSLHLSEIGALFQQELGVELPISVLRESKGTDLKGTAKLVEQLALKQQPSPLVQLGGESSMDISPPGPTIILLHPTNGSLSCYNALVHRIMTSHSDEGRERPSCYGIQDHGLKFDSVSQMATYYVEVIKRRFPSRGGPYILGGYSSGGYVAWEMATLMKDEHVPLLFLYDTKITRNLEQEERKELVRKYEQRRSCQGLTVSKDMITLGVQRYQMGLNFQPKLIPTSTQVVLIKASQEDNKNGVTNDSSLWSDFLDGGNMKIHGISGDHNSMMYEPCAESIAEIMNTYINSVLKNIKF